MSKKIALTLGFATLVSMTAVGGASAADKASIVDAIHAQQAQARMEIVQMVETSRQLGVNVKTADALSRIHAKQAQSRREVAQMIEKSRMWGMDPVTVAYLDMAKDAEGNQPQLAKKKVLGGEAQSNDIDG